MSILQFICYFSERSVLYRKIMRYNVDFINNELNLIYPIIHIGQMLVPVLSIIKLLNLQNLRVYACVSRGMLKGFERKRAFQRREKPK